MKERKYNVYNDKDIRVATISDIDNHLSLEVLVDDIHELPTFLQEVEKEEDILRFLTLRVLPNGRHGLDESMKAHGIKEYDWRELIVYNSGRTLTDTFYVLTEIDGVESEKSTVTSSVELVTDFEYEIDDIIW